METLRRAAEATAAAVLLVARRWKLEAGILHPKRKNSSRELPASSSEPCRDFTSTHGSMDTEFGYLQTMFPAILIPGICNFAKWPVVRDLAVI